MNISHLIQATQHGDREAFAQLVRAYQQPLFGFLGRMGYSQAEAQDAAQDTFLRVWTHIGHYDPSKGQFSTWLYTIARNQAANRRISYQRESTQLYDDGPSEQTDEAPSVLDQLLRQEEFRRLHVALRQLSFADRSALALSYVQELDMVSIARIEDCSLSSIKTRLHRAKLKLRLALEASND